MTALGSCGNAQIIYSNFFNGGTTTINDTAPTVTDNLGGGISSALWTFTYTNNVTNFMANGAIGTNAGCALLPFTPQPGAIYTMTASITLPADMSAAYVAMGFSQVAIPTNNQTYARFSDANAKGNPWMLARTGGTAADQFFGGPGTALETDSGDLVSTAGTYTLEIVLNTTGVQWTTAAYVNGVEMGTNIIYPTNPTIGFAGISQSGVPVSGVQWNYWSLSITTPSGVSTNYWAAPAAIGTGDGSSSINAAGYLNSSFWSRVQSQLQSGDVNVNVNLLSGAYSGGTLTMTDMGNPLHRLTLQAVNLYGSVFSTTGSTIINLVGSQNITFYGLQFTGTCSSWGVEGQPDYLKPCRNLEFSYCQFLNLTNVTYGAIGLVNGTRDVLVNSCTFTNLGYGTGGTAHFIYSSHDIVDVQVLNSSFADCRADYVRFRDDSEYCVVSNCTFISTISATSFPFITSPLYNDTDPGPGDEFFGNYFQITGNTFTYKVAAGTRAAFQFSDSGYNSQSYDCALTTSQAAQLGGGTTAFKQSFLQTNMGVIASGIKMSGNTYNSVTYPVAYTYTYTSDATNAPRNGWQGSINISDVPDSSGALLSSLPKLRNADFDRQGLLQVSISASLKDYECLFRTWLCNPKYTDILQHPGFAGTTNALRFDKTTTQYVYQWISSPTPNWTADFLFAIGSGFTGTGTKFKVDIFHNDIAAAKVSIGVNNAGQFGIYNGGTFTVLPELGTVVFSIDNNGNGLFTDAGDALNVYHLRIAGNYSATTPYVDIYTSDANSLTLNHESPRKSFWVNGAPVSNQSAPGTIAFYNYTAPVVLDQIAFNAGIPPVITNIFLNNGNLILAGTNGSANVSYSLLSSTNLTLPVANWTRLTTNTFTGDAFLITNPISSGAASGFYRLQLQ